MVLSFTMLDDQLAFPVGSAWETTEAVQCGDASLWPVSGLVFFGASDSDPACSRVVSLQRLPPAAQESNGGLAFPPQPTVLPPCGALRQCLGAL